MGGAAGRRTGTDADRAILRIVFSAQRSPDAFLAGGDEDLLQQVRREVPGVTPEECHAAGERIRGLVIAVLDVSDAFRDGRFGTGPGAQRDAVAALGRAAPGFSEEEYAAAFAAGLLWTAF